MLDSLEDLSDKLAMVRLEDNAKIDNGITRPKRELNWSLGKKKKPQKKTTLNSPKSFRLGQIFFEVKYFILAECMFTFWNTFTFITTAWNKLMENINGTGNTVCLK